VGRVALEEETMDDRQLRSDVVELLRGGSAHVPWEQALAGLAPAHRAASPGRGLHTVWELVEHMRLAQEDILRYALEPGWRSPAWPSGYWPSVKQPTAKQWKASLAAFRRDLEAVVAMVLDPKVDLTAALPHGEGGHTYLREVLLVADHNAHHLGQVVVARRLLGDWK
jgi:uncharacterized damage-inducible protein DinB